MRHTRSGGVRLVLLGGILVTAFVLVGFGATAMAQEQQQEQPKTQVKEEVVVTGTLIPRPTLEALSPVATMDVEELSYRGLTRLEDLMTSLPQVFAAQNSTIANGASGTATVSLRNLGDIRTLVLIDGKRVQSGDMYTIAPDLNFIPAAMLKRVDVLTGGASAAYGADAVAGVVNFILDKDFEGVRGGITFGGYQHNNNNAEAQAALNARSFYVPASSVWGGGAFDANVALGGKFADGKGHASAYAEYRTTSALLKKYRDYTACSFGFGATGPACSGSSTIPDGRFIAFTSDYSRSVNWTLDRSGPGDTFRRRTSADVFNYGPINFMQRPDQRLTAGGFVNYDFNVHAQGYLSIMTMNDDTDAQIAPSGDFGNTSQINCDNPMLSADQYQKLCVDMGYGPHDIAEVTILKRNVEGGPRFDQLSHQAFRVLGGLKGEIDRAWSYDVFGLWGQTRVNESYHNDLNVTRLQDALIVDGERNDPSTWHCRSGNAGCVPWNVFKIGGVTQEALAYLALPLQWHGIAKTQVIQGELHGDLKDWGLAFPSATEGFQLALGLDYRKEFLDLQTDLAFQTGIGSGQGGAQPSTSGMYSVKEAFVELLIPIAQDVKGAQDLNLDLGYRYSDYAIDPDPAGTGGGTFPTWKVQANWAPISSFKFRAGINHATRAPNVQELYVPQSLGLGGTQDICAGEVPTATLAQCVLTGVRPEQYGNILPNPADQYNSLDGGNPNLQPEVADTTTYGIVITPTGSSFTAALDYYEIKIEDRIGNLNPDDTVQACATTGDPYLCSLVHRDIAGTLWLFTDAYTIATQQNVGKLGSEGVDASLSYTLPAGNTFFSFSLMGTYLISNNTDTGLFQYDCTGYFGNQCGVPLPKWRHLSRASWETGPVVLSLGWRYIAPVDNDDLSSNSFLGDPANVETLAVNGIDKIAAYNYFDLAFTYKLKGGVTFLLGVNNIMDEEPPLAPGMSDADYGPGFYGTYDPYGRYVFSSIQFTF